MTLSFLVPASVRMPGRGYPLVPTVGATCDSAYAGKDTARGVSTLAYTNPARVYRMGRVHGRPQ